ncbi:MAG: HAD-IIB family hydrolase [Planctomycetota bacterium]
MSPSPNIVIFSDLDGCLLNKQDYSFAPAKSTLQRIRESQIPLVLASSKTVVEMRRLAEEMELADAPLICENGGAIFWTNQDTPDSVPTVLGVDRSQILEVLDTLKSTFKFESFRDLGVQGVMRATDLSEVKSKAALERASTEPLLWHDEADRIEDFRQQLSARDLTLTRGGRFWHVAGSTTKGSAMQRVTDQLYKSLATQPTTLAIGDSPIDQSMLDIADYPIGVPWPDGVVHVTTKGHNGVTASLAGASGWAEAVTKVLDSLTI